MEPLVSLVSFGAVNEFSAELLYKIAELARLEGLRSVSSGEDLEKTSLRYYSPPCGPRVAQQGD